VVTVILGYLFFHERITPLQAGGILVTFVGVALVSI
ncbi:MAG: EamA family transporter, partial [Anaerolineae bacterium]|nr:EamA family transporter [Anaerolineae bacterium]